MPLSEHEQRLFEEIERSLAEDPKFASAVRSSDPRVHARRRIVFAALTVILGLGLVVFGTVSGQLLLGAGGFVVMLAAATFAMHSRRGKSPTLHTVGGSASRSTRRRFSLIDRLESRWRRRPEGNR